MTIDIRSLIGSTSSIQGVDEKIASAIRIAVWAALGKDSTQSQRAAEWGPLYEQYLLLSPEDQQKFIAKFNKKASA